MSIDNFIWMPAGARDDKSIGYRKYKFWKGVLAAETSTVPRHQVFLAHGANVLIDDQYFIEDPQDARWFWEEGYNERLFLLDEEEGESAGYDQMSLWIDGALLAQREYAGRIWVYRRIRTRTAQYDEVSNRHDRHGGEEMKHVGRGKRMV